MATPACVKCGHTSFEMSESAISGLRFKRDFLHCGKCGGVICVVEADNLNARLDAIEERLKALQGGIPHAGPPIPLGPKPGRKHTA
jgi:hypothetical protein